LAAAPLSAINPNGDERADGCGRPGGAMGCNVLRGLLSASRVIDAINDRFGWISTWLVLFACLLSTANALVRYGLNGWRSLTQTFPFLQSLDAGLVWYGNNANSFLEAQWYMFAAIVLLGAPYVLKLNEHVRVDLIYSMVSERTRIWIDILGGVLFLLPICVILVYFTWPFFVDSWQLHETSSNAGGLVRWPVKLLLPIGFGLMALQGVSEIIKRIAALRDSYRLQYRYETPLQ
jgi:TRAP-type mannitol/chloroaromatic compound transport system permease small subunit